MNKIVKTVGLCATTAALAVSIIAGPYYLTGEKVNYQYTSAELAEVSHFAEELSEITDNYNVSFTNPDFYKALQSTCSSPLTIESIRDIRSLKIDLQALQNKDLSDLKYLVNLEALEISNGLVDCSDLRYNQNLTYMTFDSCNFTNSNQLPNSISSISFNDSNVLDYTITIPYNCSDVNFNNTVFNKLNVKNPEKLETLYFNGYSLFDLTDIKDCTNLKTLSLTQCPNIKHPEYIKRFEKLVNINIDEFCCVWADYKTFKNMPEKYRIIIHRLDEAANALVTADMTDEEKIEHLTLFVTSQIEYDFDALTNEKALTAYNTEPLSYAFEKRSGVCVGYATLFKALANRVGLDSYQPDSVNHTWNMVRIAGNTEYLAYDITELDNKGVITGSFSNKVIDENNSTSQYINSGHSSELLYFGFNPADDIDNKHSYTTSIENISVPETSSNIGYIDIKAPVYRNEIKSLRLKISCVDFFILMFALTIVDKFKKSDSKEEDVKYTKTKKRKAYKNFEWE